MTEITLDPSESTPPKKRKLLPVLFAIVLAGMGFGSTYQGLWAPSTLLSSVGSAKSDDPLPVFVVIPPLEMSIPGTRLTLWLAGSIETDAAHEKVVVHQMPRVLDTFTIFLSNVAPAAYDKRGVLEIIRAELLSRTRQAVGEEAVKDLLITEFRIK